MLCVAYFNVLSDKVSTTSFGSLEKSHSQDFFSLWYSACIVFPFIIDQMFFTVKNLPKRFLSLLSNYTLLVDTRVVLQRVSRKMFWLNQTHYFPGMGAGAATKQSKRPEREDGEGSLQSVSFSRPLKFHSVWDTCTMYSTEHSGCILYASDHATGLSGRKWLIRTGSWATHPHLQTGTTVPLKHIPRWTLSVDLKW